MITTLRLLPVLVLVVLVPLVASAATPQELLDTGRADEAIQLLTPQATGNNAAAYNYLGRVYYALDAWDDAVRFCERAAQLEPNNAQFQLWLGRTYGEKANAAPALTAYSLARKSVAAFTAAHSLDPRNEDIARDLAEYFTSAPSIVGGGSTKALALASEVDPLFPVTAAWIRALVASNAGRYDDAEREYFNSIRLDHDSADAQLEYARFLRGRKRWEQFQQTIEHAVQSRNIRPEDRYNAAEMLLKSSRNLPLAAREMRDYIESGHTVEDAPVFRAHYLLGQIMEKSGDNAKAASEYRAALALASGYQPASEALARLGMR
jgi:tetratricopeptide (TPR) repeat protein